MIEEEDARAQILASVAETAVEAIPLDESLGRFVARDVIAQVAIPGFDNSAMDGYAVRAAGGGCGGDARGCGAGRGNGKNR